MNPLGHGNIGNGLPPELMQNIKNVKWIMNMFKGKPDILIQQNPMLNQVMQMCQGKNPEEVFKTMCKNSGIDVDAFIKALKD